ncbi:hypothetical protein PHYSODRAFT_288653 [Phytophthora sojae]|uniref:Uncharacterized protein n=1 Tax=Phytophthora sojae (strain P6497) TaxID=1094619 RepID=G5A6H4_PHYSP|nr:hypothetical protein PHYSODRAFT_288653 [Phytophthora sojae]EGZ08929.1 hypothetical protein PHYSODRAFT_288653 [Phytophthora sojae]|eukprot:XP_009535562.1 hypothetical protein PHYSODRAFT_288653 [Phytophthora sojae]
MKRFRIPEGFIVVVEGITAWLDRPGSSDEWEQVTRDSGWGVVHPIASDGPSPGICQLQTGLYLQENEHGGNLPYMSKNSPVLLSRPVSEVLVPMRKDCHQQMDNKMLEPSS